MRIQGVYNILYHMNTKVKALHRIHERDIYSVSKMGIDLFCPEPHHGHSIFFPFHHVHNMVLITVLRDFTLTRSLRIKKARLTQ